MSKQSKTSPDQTVVLKIIHVVVTKLMMIWSTLLQGQAQKPSERQGLKQHKNTQRIW